MKPTEKKNSPCHEHFFSGRVFLEDTDAIGIVYYAKYLHFAERARNEWLRDLGFPHQQLQQNFQCSFVVRKCNIRYFRALKFDDCFLVHSLLQSVGGMTLSMEQTIYRTEILESANLLPLGGKTVSQHVELACLHQHTGKPITPPTEFLEIFRKP